MDPRKISPNALLRQVAKSLKAGRRQNVGELAVARGYLSHSLLQEIMARVPDLQDGDNLGVLLVQEGLLTATQFLHLKEELEKIELEEAIVVRRQTPPPEVEKAMAEQDRSMGRYVLLEKIGTGGMAEVWKGWDRTLSRPVAIKFLKEDPSFREGNARFLREAVLAGKLRHPNIVAVLDTGLWQNRAYIVMDLVEHGNLDTWWRRKQPTFSQIAVMLRKVTQGVQEAHKNGIIHRDIKPANILVDGREEPLLSDFGLARTIVDDEKLTQTGTLLGTPIYMAPEQTSSDPSSVDERSDVYSIGVILYEFLTGRPPFQGKNIAELIRKITSDRPPPTPRSLNPDIPRDLETICLRAMAREIGDRYTNTAAMARDLSLFAEGEPVMARRLSLSAKIVRWSLRNPLPSTMAVLLLLSLLAGGGFLSLRQTEHEQHLQALQEVQRGERAFRDGRYHLAITMANRALEIEPELPEAYFLSGRTSLYQYTTGRPAPVPWRLLGEVTFLPSREETGEERELLQTARSAFSKIDPEKGDGTKEWRWRWARGMLAFIDGDYPEAIRKLGEVREDALDLDVEYLLALSHYYLRNFLEASEVLKAFPPGHHWKVDLLGVNIAHGIAVSAEFQNRDPGPDYATALQMCENLPSTTPQDIRVRHEAFILTSRAMYRSKMHWNNRPALADLSRAIDSLESHSSPSDNARLIHALARISRGRILQADSRFSKADLYFRKAIELLAPITKKASPAFALTRGWALVSQAGLLAITGNSAEAERHLAEATGILKMIEEETGPVPESVYLWSQIDILSLEMPAGAERAVERLENSPEESIPESDSLRIRIFILNELALWILSRGGIPAKFCENRQGFFFE